MKKNLIITLVIAAVVCSMAGGATMAWFNSSASSTGSSFVAGTLTLGGINADGSDWHNKFARLDIGNIKPGEPADIGATVLKNVGSLPFKLYRITAADFTGDLSAADERGRKLDDVLSLKVEMRPEGAAQYEVVYNGRFSQLTKENGGFFDPVYDIPSGKKIDMKLTVLMSRDAGNAYQGKSFGCSLTVYASQNYMPNTGEPQGTQVYMGRTAGAGTWADPAFEVTARNTERYSEFDWNWIPNDIEGVYEYYEINIKHERGTPDNRVIAEQTFLFNKTLKLISGGQPGPLTTDNIKVDWNGDIIRIEKQPLLDAGWEGFEVKLSGRQNALKPVQTIIAADGSLYQYWSLQAAVHQN